ncbi:hypothetical protein [Chryseobacterium oranimense]|uniref:hypothetical protein n=1 Tax=Chryseobacterium oranimense TaxID=421058 RepID=UPI002235E5F1|nr:hypothetical protein [Chryseobacterium oranimense]
MESNFFSGSENLYKYLVSIGILMLVLTIYYPLKEKQELEILKIKLESEQKVLNFEIKDNKKNLDDLIKNINKKNIEPFQKEKLLLEISQKQKNNEIKQINADGKIVELENREKYICVYDRLFWIFIIVGSGLVIFGFFKWYKSKKIDDKKSEIETDILELKLSQEQQQHQNNSNQQSNTNNSTNQSTP